MLPLPAVDLLVYRSADEVLSREDLTGPHEFLEELLGLLGELDGNLPTIPPRHSSARKNDPTCK